MKPHNEIKDKCLKHRKYINVKLRSYAEASHLEHISHFSSMYILTLFDSVLFWRKLKHRNHVN